jgi:small subunit ribosomal protein S6
MKTQPTQTQNPPSARAETDASRLYEAMFLVDNREVKKGFEPARERVTVLLTKNGAAPRVVRKWDERKLAYDVARQKRATYVLAYFDAGPESVVRIRRDAELNEAILRCLVLRTDEVPAKALTEPFDVSIAPQAEETVVPEVAADLGVEPVPAELADEVPAGGKEAAPRTMKDGTEKEVQK